MTRAAKLSRGERFKLAVLDAYDYGEPELVLLDQAAEALDRADAAQAEIEKHGILIPSLHSPRVNPAISVKRDAENMVLRYARALGIVEKVTEAMDDA